jgi:hypothetical protein
VDRYRLPKTRDEKTAMAKAATQMISRNPNAYKKTYFQPNNNEIPKANQTQL